MSAKNMSYIISGLLNLYRNFNAVMHELFLESECASAISRCNYRHLREHLDTVRPVHLPHYHYVKQNQATGSGSSFFIKQVQFLVAYLRT